MRVLCVLEEASGANLPLGYCTPQIEQKAMQRASSKTFALLKTNQLLDVFLTFKGMMKAYIISSEWSISIKTKIKNQTHTSVVET